MLRCKNDVNVSGTIFWSKLDERENFSTLRLGIDIGEGTYNRIFVSITNPNEKAHKYVKSGNQIILMGAWIDTWQRRDGSKEMQIKAYDSNCQFYLPETAIPKLNDVTIYGKVQSYSESNAVIDCIGGKNPKTGELSHKYVTVDIGEDHTDIVDKKILIKGTIGSEQVEENKSELRVLADYRNINIMG